MAKWKRVRYCRHCNEPLSPIVYDDFTYYGCFNPRCGWKMDD